MVPEKIHKGLPRIRDIQHCIDLVLGSALPNKLAYRMNPIQQEELERQVNELIAKWLIRESTSHCVAPAILLPKGWFVVCAC